MCGLCHSEYKGLGIPHDRSRLLSSSSLLFCKMTVSVITSPPKQVRQFQLQSHMENLFEPDGPCSLTSSAESKNTGLASPRPALGERRAAGPPISFPCPSQACQRRAKPKKIRPAVAFGQAKTRTVW